MRLPCNMVMPLRSSRLTTIAFCVSLLLLVLFSLSLWSPSYYKGGVTVELSPDEGRPVDTHPQPAGAPVEKVPTAWAKEAEAIIQKAREMAGSPIESPYKEKFGPLGQLTRSARKWVEFLDDAPESEDTRVLREAIDGAIATLYPYLLHSPKHPGSTTPFTDLRESFKPGSRGIVIPTGKSTMRWAAHLISALQEVLHTSLPILVVYAGELDFPIDERQGFQDRFKDVEFMDIINVVDDSTLKLGDGGWAIKAFAALYTPYEQVIVLDSDCVFVQPPEVFFKDPLYTQTGALLFHDRLLWQHASKGRHEWWRSQIQNPSPAMDKSLAWTDDWSEEGDSGAVVLDKSRLDVLMGLLHVSWQNSKAVRQEVTYRMTHGDKETWWFGLELAGSNYAFEEHYGSMVGWPHAEQPENEGEDKICSFYIGHVDSKDELLWYNGGLVKHKQGDPHDFGLPTHQMVDGKWHKVPNIEAESCMDERPAKLLPHDVVKLLNKTISLAKDLDKELGFA